MFSKFKNIHKFSKKINVFKIVSVLYKCSPLKNMFKFFKVFSNF